MHVCFKITKAIEYASRATTPTEQRWAQIEKDALSGVFGLERFTQYTYGRRVFENNDHRPIEKFLKKPSVRRPDAYRH